MHIYVLPSQLSIEALHTTTLHIYAYICDSHSTLGGDTGTLDELAGSHTRLAIYPTFAIHYQRVVIHASLNTGFKGRR